MKHLFTIVFAIAILGGAYVLNFGVPAQIAQAVPFLNTEQSADAADDPRRSSQRGAGRTTSVVLQELRYRPYTDTIQTIGTAKSWRSANILAETSGRVVNVSMPANKRVEEGDILLELDDRTERLNLEVAEAELVQAEADMDRMRRLRADGSLTVSDVNMAATELALTRAVNTVNVAQLALEKRTIRAPFAGTLGLNDIQVGNLIDASEMIVSIDDAQTLLVEFELPERSISMLALGRTVLASTPSYAGRVFEAQITAYDSRIDSTTRTISVQAKLENSDGVLWSGMTFAVRFLKDSDPMASVPATALSWARHGAGIWVIEDGKARRAPVTVRFRRGGDAWVDTDLPEGTTIVVEGAAKLREGASVEAVGADGSDTGPIRASAPVSPATPAEPALETTAAEPKKDPA